MEKNKICNRCVMTSKGDSIFKCDEKGNCIYCNAAISRREKEYYPNEQGKVQLENIINTIKENGKGKKYDCMMGISGGLDSSYLAYLGYKWGLRILAVHIDDGFDSELATENVNKLVEKCGLDLIIIKPDEKQYYDLTLAFMKASLPNIAIPQDNILTASLYNYAKLNDMNYFLSGYNFPLESILQAGNSHRHSDVTHIKAIAKQFCVGKIDKLRFISANDIEKMRKKLNLQTIYPLNYMKYTLKGAIDELEAFCGYQYYEAKHFESILTRFLQTYYLPTKFGVDKRTSHLSSLIIDGQMTRDEALELLKHPTIRQTTLESDIEFIIKKLGISREEFDKIMSLPPKQHTDYRIDPKIRVRSMLSRIKHAILKRK